MGDKYFGKYSKSYHQKHLSKSLHLLISLIIHKKKYEEITSQPMIYITLMISIAMRTEDKNIGPKTRLSSD